MRQKELTYFFELTNPIISLEIMFVLGMGISVIYVVLQDEYGGDLVAFLVQFVVESNLALLVAFMVLTITVTLMVHLGMLLKPYGEQDKHQSFMDRISLILRFEAANGKSTQYKATMDLLDDLKEQMLRVKTSPKLLGLFMLNKSRIQSIIGSVTLTVTAFAVTYLQSSISEIGEATSSSFAGTTTAAPTPTAMPIIMSAVSTIVPTSA